MTEKSEKAFRWLKFLVHSAKVTVDKTDEAIDEIKKEHEEHVAEKKEKSDPGS